MADYSDLLAGNPYFQPAPRSNLSTLGQMLANMGAGIAGAGASGQPWMAGIAPGAAMASNAVAKQKEQDELEESRRFQMGLHLQQLKQLQDDRDLKNKGIAALVAANGGGAPEGVPGGGMNVQPNAVQMGPRAPSPQATAISGIESAGQPNKGYGAVGPIANSSGDRAYGKYQIMGSNIPAWTKESLGQEMTPQQFMQNPQAQDAVFKDQFGKLEKKYGPVKAAGAWFAGEKGMNNPNAKDVNGMTVGRYQNQFVNNGGAPGAAPGGAGPTFASLPPFEGVGMPDPAMQPGALPPGVDPKINLPSALTAPSASPVLPPFQIPGMPSGPTPPAAPSSPLQPAIAQGGSDASPTPQPIQPAQFTQPPAMPAPGPPPQIPRPTQLPAAEANVLNNMLMTRAITPEQFLAQKNKRLDEIHHDAQTAATEAWKQQNENYRFNRGEANKEDRWEILQPPQAQALGLPPGVIFKRNKSGDIKPVQDTKEPNKDISAQFAGPDVDKLVSDMAPADRAAFKAQVALGDQKGASASLRAQQQKIPESMAGVHGEDFLKTRTLDEQNVARALNEGRILPSDLKGRTDEANHYLKLAMQADPSYTPNDAGARRAFENKYMVTGLGGQQLQAANTVMPHLETWLRLQTALNSGDSQTVNSILNAAKKQFGDAKVTSAEAASELYGTEVARAIRGGGALNEKEELAAKAMTNASRLSPDQAKGVASTLTEMMMGRVHVLQETGRMHGVSEDKVNSYMLPSSREALTRIQNGDFSGGKGTEPPKMRPPLDRFQR